MNFTDGKGIVILLHTAGTEGFKNAKKGTNIAGQQAAITLANVSIDCMRFFKSLIMIYILLNTYIILNIEHIYLSSECISVIQRILEYGVNTVRIRVQGIGAGRMVCI